MTSMTVGVVTSQAGNKCCDFRIVPGQIIAMVQIENLLRRQSAVVIIDVVNTVYEIRKSR